MTSIVGTPVVVLVILVEAIVSLLVLLTRSVRAARALRQSEERIRLVADRAPVMIWTARPDTTLTCAPQFFVSFATVLIGLVNVRYLWESAGKSSFQGSTFVVGLTIARNRRSIDVLSRYRMRATAAVVLVLSAPLNLAAQRVRDEVVELSSGDRVTGEIKGLDRSYLTVRTIDLGTVQIRWQRVVRLNSTRMLEIVLVDGRRLEGSVVSPTPRTLDVTGGGGTVNVDLASIVAIRPVARSWIGDLTGQFDAGFDYTRGSDVADASVNAEVISRSPAYEGTLTFNAVLTVVEGQPDSSQYFLGYRDVRFFTERVFVGSLADVQGNRDLGIEIRGSVGAGPGYRLVKTQRQELEVLGMPLLVREVPLEEPASTQGLALAAARYSLFLNEYPKTNLDVTSQLRFGLSEPGRFLLLLNASVRRELWHDFFIAGSVYDSYDNRPPASSTLENDVGVKLTLGWSF